MPQFKKQKPRKGDATPYTKVKIAPIAQKAHSSALVADAHKVFQKERAKIDATIEAFMVHKAVKDGAVFKMLKGAVLGQAQAFDEKEKRKPTRAQQIAKKTERHDAIRAEIEAQRLVPAEKPINFDD